MTREELDFIGSMNMCDEISNEAYKKIVCHCGEQEPCEDAISRQEAIDAIDKWVKVEHILETLPTDKVTPLFKSVHKLPSVNSQPCENAISRQAVLDAITANCIWENEYNLTSSRIKKAVESLPSVTTQSKTGHWIIKDGKEQGYDIAGIKTWYIQIMCDKCGFIKTAIEGHTGHYKYCPNCGCHMVEPQERSDKE